MSEADGAHGAPGAPQARPHQAMGPGAEFDTIRLLMARWGDLVADIGDDAAVLTTSAARVADGWHLVVSTDASIEGAHFREGWLTPDEVGARSMAAALSDLAAMGAMADAVLIAFTVPEAWRRRLPDVADGIARVLRPTGARIVGGNISAGAAFGITTTVIGAARRVVSRRGAQPGDVLLVTGLLGGPGQAVAAAYAGRTTSAWARQRFASPEPRLVEGERLAAAGVHAMLDLSDGLAADARHMAAASGVRLRLDATRVPTGPGVGVLDALGSGEEYELLAAAHPDVVNRLLAEWSGSSTVPLTIVGDVVSADDAGAVDIVGLADDAGRVEFVSGHDHFSG